ncbi:hypothetical protein GJAV_G00232180 [Gymnothorax javanicus]|nr:hypothetical protein GJAV_G00232180 [Gymnothorax javanicus]
MDEDDSQDEVTGRSSSCRKGKRPLSSIFSDEEDDSDESGEGETDSGDDNDDDVGDESEVGEDEETLDGDDDEDEEEDEEEDDSDRDEIDAAKAGLEGGVGRAVGGSSAEFSYLSSDEDAEKCPICLNTFHEQPVATPETCEHYFCLDCILEWSKNANSCPVDRIVFNKICLRKNHGGQVQKVIPLQKPLTAEGGELDQTNCEVCGQSDREDRLLLCDGCDAGYHMECLTPPLDAVPVEEWFCPRCSPSNVRSAQLSAPKRIKYFPTHSGIGSSSWIVGYFQMRVEKGGVSSMAPGGAVPTTSRRARAFAAGPTRAIARTQQSERVRANVNRNRITQARTSSEAPMLSSWLDEAINAVVAGLSTAVYVRDLTPRPGTSRRRRTVKRRKTAGKKMNEKTGGKMDGKEKPKGKGVKRRRRRRRRVRRTKSRRKLVVKKDLTARSRIAKNLGLGKPTHSTSIPSVYRPIEQSLGGMRADIGAASLSVYGDPFDLDPFYDENERSSAPPSPVAVKRQGLSRSALRSHQPVARPIPVGLHRRGLSIPEPRAVTETAPVPDLLGSIMSGQSMLMMDSSDVVINRDGSLKAIKPVSVSSPKAAVSKVSGSACSPAAEVHTGSGPSGCGASPPGRPSSMSTSLPLPHFPPTWLPPTTAPRQHAQRLSAPPLPTPPLGRRLESTLLGAASMVLFEGGIPQRSP